MDFAKVTGDLLNNLDSWPQGSIVEAGRMGKVECMSFRINYKNQLLMGGAVALVLIIPAMAADNAAGLKAFQAGNYAAAFKEWKPLADKGDANAECNLGIMFQKGL